ncbi:MAG: hypothetical protein ABMA25_09510 [Ilumatobacteraceae bacterium]
MSTSAFRKAFALLGAVALVGLAACSSDASVQGATTTVAVGGDVTTTVVAPPVTDATNSTVAPTDAPTTTAAPATAGWTTIDPATTPGPGAFPCCASNWYGESSPALPAPGAALADGIYAIEFTWPTDFSQPVVATVTRFEQCSILPAGSCEDNGGVPYADDEVGIDRTATFDLPLVFDDQLHFVLGGFGGWDGPAFAVGNGVDMAALVASLDADYQVAIMEPYLAGTSQDDIAIGLAATPAHGFSAPAEEGAGALVYTHNGAPPLLFQGIVGYDDTPADTRGSDIIGRISLVVEGGQLTINTYAGFYS